MLEHWKYHFRASRFQNFLEEHAPDPPKIAGPPAPWLSHSPTFPESAAYFKTFWNLCFTLWLLLTAFFKLQFLIIAVPYYQCLEPRWFQRCPLAVWLDHLLVKLPSPAHKKSCNSSDHCHCFCSKWQASSDVVCPPIPVLEEPTETIMVPAAGTSKIDARTLKISFPSF